jgi:hypothetical protein
MNQFLPEQVNLATITRKMLQTSAIKLNVATVGALAKFVIEMGFEGNYLEEVAEHHSQHINPTELSVSHTIFESIVSQIEAKHILVRLGLACAAFTAEKVEARVRPMPDVSRFFATSDFASLAKNKETLDQTEAYLRSIRADFTEVLCKHTTLANARKFLRQNEMQTVRMICGKPALAEYPFGSASSVKLQDRLTALKNNWLKYVGKHITEANLHQTYGTDEDEANSQAPPCPLPD